MLLAYWKMVIQYQSDITVILRSEDNGIFSFRFIQLYFDLVGKGNGNDWSSFVVDLKNKEINWFHANKSLQRNIRIIVNDELNEEWENLKNSHEYALEINPLNTDAWSPLVMGEECTFTLPIYHEGEIYRWETGLLAILYSWIMTSPDAFGPNHRFNGSTFNFFGLVHETSIERFRQLLL